MFQTEAGRFDVAAPLLDEALERLRRSGRRGTAEYAGAPDDIGYAWQVQGQHDRAEALLAEALAEYEKLSEPLTGMGAALNNLGYIRISRGDPDSAEVLFRRSVEVRRQLGDEINLARALEALGGALVRKGKLIAADSAASGALRIRRAVLPEGHYEIAGAIILRARILHRQGRPAEAEPLYREALAIRIAALGEGHFVVADSRNSLALALQAVEPSSEPGPSTRFSDPWTRFPSRLEGA
jgi:tetratricopeptide (TPR) repeat protein